MAAQDYMSDTSQFDLARKRAQQQSGANLQGRKDALARRFAALGNLDAGARLKIEQKAENEEAQGLAQANEGIDAAQNQEMGRRREILQAQEFSRGERESGQKFGAEQAALQRAWGSGEREAGQLFATGEREAGQEYQTGVLGKQQQFAVGEREAMVRAQAEEASRGRAFTRNENSLARKEQSRQFGISTGLQQQQIGIAKDQLAASMDQFQKTLEQQQYETEKSLQAQRNAGDKNVVSQTKNFVAQGNPFRR